MVSEDLIVKYLAGEAEAHEIALLEQWRKLSDENELKYKQIAQLWMHAGSISKDHFIDVDVAWNKVNKKIQKAPAKIVPLRRIWLAAASLVIVVGLALWAFNTNKKEELNLSAKVEKQKLKIVLPDHSKVLLMSGALEYPKAFEKNVRHVKLLSGRAYFEIAKDSVHQFEIECAQTTVTVLGTKFEISSEGKNISVTVNEGKVRFSTPAGTSILTKGMKAEYNAAISSLNTITEDNLNELVYATGILKYNNTDLIKVISDIAKWDNRTHIVLDPALYNCRISGQFDLNEGLENVLKILSLTVNAQVEVKSGKNELVISGGPCQ